MSGTAMTIIYGNNSNILNGYAFGSNFEYRTLPKYTSTCCLQGQGLTSDQQRTTPPAKPPPLVIYDCTWFKLGSVSLLLDNLMLSWSLQADFFSSGAVKSRVFCIWIMIRFSNLMYEKFQVYSDSNKNKNCCCAVIKWIMLMLIINVSTFQNCGFYCGSK